MRKLFSAVVLTAVLATPALAQSSRTYHAQHGAAWDAVNGVEGYAGQDPDPNVRLELRRDFYRE
jgi:predicted S18 family serine protease